MPEKLVRGIVISGGPVITDYVLTDSASLEKIVRQIRNNPENNELPLQVAKIIRDVRENGDEALVSLTNKYDGTNFTETKELIVTPEEIRAAYSRLSSSELRAIKQEMRQILALSKNQMKRFQETEFKSPLRFTVTESYSPFSRIGGYVPGGLGSYPSTVLMICVPAREAGVKEIVLATPPKKDGRVSDSVLVAADLGGASQVIKAGGAQAIAAIGLGTDSINKVSLIVGPGNDYVTEAKKQLAASGETLIDSLAGPTELLIVADENSNPYFIAQDLISQAEHGNRTLCGLVSYSQSLIRSVRDIVASFSIRPRQEQINRSSLFTVLTTNIQQAVEFSQIFAPEHLELMVKRPESYESELTNTGLLLIGDYAPCSSTDYMVGTNHILPTGGTAVNFSGLGVERFMKRVTMVKGNRISLQAASRFISTLANMEGFPNHAAAVEARFENRGKRK
ncbi:MAG: histidinol dehydrogenase [Thaumarchaeota archaeon]|nr:histidinol dehydrogenase [Nitrososphaerota archaeon]